MNLVYVTDDNFAQHTGISLISLLENNKDLDSISIHICDNGIKEENIIKLKKIAERYSRSICFVKTQECLEECLDVETKKQVMEYYGTLVGCLQFLFDKVFPDLDEIFYIDSDTIIEGALKEIYDMKMGDHLIAAVASPGTLISDNISERELAYSKKYYYNTGVMYINLRKWTQDEVFKRVIEELKSGKKYAFGAQSIINNLISDNEFIKLDIKYNYWGFQYNKKLHDKIYELGNYYTYDSINEARLEPIIVHFKGFERPWFYEFSNRYYSKRYLYYKDMTGEEGWKTSQLQSYYHDVYHKKRKRRLDCLYYRLGNIYRDVYERNIRIRGMLKE